jgi:hypothetical protein
MAATIGLVVGSLALVFFVLLGLLIFAFDRSHLTF